MDIIIMPKRGVLKRIAEAAAVGAVSVFSGLSLLLRWLIYVALFGGAVAFVKIIWALPPYIVIISALSISFVGIFLRELFEALKDALEVHLEKANEQHSMPQEKQQNEQGDRK